MLFSVLKKIWIAISGFSIVVLLLFKCRCTSFFCKQQSIKLISIYPHFRHFQRLPLIFSMDNFLFLESVREPSSAFKQTRSYCILVKIKFSCKGKNWYCSVYTFSNTLKFPTFHFQSFSLQMHFARKQIRKQITYHITKF